MATHQPLDRDVVATDATSQADLATAGSGIDRVMTKTLRSDWLRSVSIILDAIDDIDTIIRVDRATQLGFCGARYRAGYRGPNGGGISLTSVTVTSNVATGTATAHWFVDGDYIETTGLSTNATQVPVTVVDANTVSWPVVAADGPLSGAAYISGHQNPLDQLPNTLGGREAWFRLVDGRNPDIFEDVRAYAPSAATPNNLADPRSETGLASRYTGPEYYDYVIERGQRGTTARDWEGASGSHANPCNTQIYDITIAVEMAESRIARFAYGLPVVVLKTKLSEIAVQVGDFVTHDAAAFVAFGIDGATSADVFEVVSKNIDKDANPPCIEWTLKYVRSD